MGKLWMLVLVFAISLSGTGCSYIAAKKVPILGVESGGKCKSDQLVYYYRDAGTAVCLPNVMVAYTHCVTELTVANSTSEFSNLTQAEVASIYEKVKGVKLSEDEKKKLQKAYSESGVIGTARAKAIDACREITEGVYGKSSGGAAPQIQLNVVPMTQ